MRTVAASGAAFALRFAPWMCCRSRPCGGITGWCRLGRGRISGKPLIADGLFVENKGVVGFSPLRGAIAGEDFGDQRKSGKLRSKPIFWLLFSRKPRMHERFSLVVLLKNKELVLLDRACLRGPDRRNRLSHPPSGALPRSFLYVVNRTKAFSRYNDHVIQGAGRRLADRPS